MDDRLSEHQISDLWATHLPRRNADDVSAALLRTLVLIIEYRARRLAPASEFLEELPRTLSRLCIPQFEFDLIKGQVPLLK